MSSPDALAAGAALDGHVIEALLGRGGSGTVYRARDPRGRAVAIKVLHPELAPSPEHAHRFAREARALRLLRHPNVIAIDSVGTLPGGEPYLVMELLAGRSVEAALAERGRLAPDELERVLDPLCDALSAAHALGIVHRDVKPSNVFLAAGDRVVLLDFGIAKLVDEEGITSARQIVGTPASMAPEQILGGRVDARTDVYGLGAFCHHVLTGRPPFSGTPMMAMQNHLHVRPPAASSRAPVPAEVDRVLDRALAKAPEQRFADARSFLAAFRAAAFAPRARVGGPEQRALGVHLEVTAADAQDASARRDAAAVLALAAAAAERAGWVTLLESGNSLLWAAPCRGPRDQRAAIDAVLALADEIEARGAPPAARASARLRMHADQADRIEDWVPDAGGEGVAATPAALAGTGLDGEPDGGLVRLRPLTRR